MLQGMTNQGATTEGVRFTAGDGLTLAGELHLPAGPPRAHALLAHCFTCGKDLPASRTLASELAESGIAALRFDFAGVGESSGDFADTTFSSNVRDLLAAASYLHEIGRAPDLAIGHSLGGAAVLAAARHLPQLRGVATIAAPSDPEHVTHLLAGEIGTILGTGQSAVRIGPRHFTVRREFLEDLEAQHLESAIPRLPCPLLVMHSPADEVVPLSNATRIFTQAAHPRSFVSLADADHLLRHGSHARYAARVIAAWASLYLGEA